MPFRASAGWVRADPHGWFVRYLRGDAVETALGLSSLDEVASAPGVLGASRLFAHSAFRPEILSTFVFGPRDVEIEVAHARTEVWSRRSADPVGARLRRGRLRLEEAPRSLRSWKALVAASRSAPDCCDLFMPDGIGYRHKVRAAADVADLFDVKWTNPSREEHPRQCALLNAYVDCLLKALETGPR